MRWIDGDPTSRTRLVGSDSNQRGAPLPPEGDRSGVFPSPATALMLMEHLHQSVEVGTWPKFWWRVASIVLSDDLLATVEVVAAMSSGVGWDTVG